MNTTAKEVLAVLDAALTDGRTPPASKNLIQAVEILGHALDVLEGPGTAQKLTGGGNRLTCLPALAQALGAAISARAAGAPIPAPGESLASTVGKGTPSRSSLPQSSSAPVAPKAPAARAKSALETWSELSATNPREAGRYYSQHAEEIISQQTALEQQARVEFRAEQERRFRR